MEHQGQIVLSRRGLGPIMRTALWTRRVLWGMQAAIAPMPNVMPVRIRGPSSSKRIRLTTHSQRLGDGGFSTSVAVYDDTGHSEDR
jgi:hypothetical protein